MKFLLLLVLLIPAAQAQTKPSKQIKILAYNVYGLKWMPFVRRHNPKKRSEFIAKFLRNSDYDIIAFQEAFHGGMRKKFNKYLTPGYPYNTGRPRNGLMRFYNNGLYVFSKYPIVERKISHP